jgi:serine/threonine protein kinase
VDDFLRRHCPDAPPAVVGEFRARVQALASIDPVLHAAAERSEVLTDAGPDTARLGHPALSLQPGAEPVPGFRLVSRLGRGGFGEVWRATGPGGFPVALKFLPMEEGLAGVELRALEAVREVRHPHLLSLSGSWQVGGYLVIAMELADRTLLDRLKEARAQGLVGIPGEELLRYMEEAARGLDFLHASAPGRAGIQHRDVKPHN